MTDKTTRPLPAGWVVTDGIRSAPAVALDDDGNVLDQTGAWRELGPDHWLEPQRVTVLPAGTYAVFGTELEPVYAVMEQDRRAAGWLYGGREPGWVFRETAASVTPDFVGTAAECASWAEDARRRLTDPTAGSDAA